jgi:hypothetical protein
MALIDSNKHDHLAGFKSHMSVLDVVNITSIGGSRSGDYEEYYLLVCAINEHQEERKERILKM